jgi:5-methylcytosine-specific restriction endonuclease McrA
MLVKVCSKCKVEKLISEFHKRNDRASGLKSHCISCCIESAKEYYKNNKKKMLKKNKIYRDENKEQLFKKRQIYCNNNKEIIQEKQHAYYQTNRDTHIEHNHSYYNANQKQILEQKRNYWKINKEELNKKQRQRRKDDPEKIRSYGRKARHKRRALTAEAKIENFNPSEVFKRDSYICQSCGIKTRPDYKNYNHDKYPNLDHIIPLSLGGEHSKRNTQCLCHKCNMAKNNTGVGDQLRMFG